MKYTMLSYTIVFDPLEPGALAAGFRLNAEDVKTMLQMGHFTPGTVLRLETKNLVVNGDGPYQKLRAIDTHQK